MAIYQINDDEIIPIQETSFSERGLKERSDLQKLIGNRGPSTSNRGQVSY